MASPNKPRRTRKAPQTVVCLLGYCPDPRFTLASRRKLTPEAIARLTSIFSTVDQRAEWTDAVAAAINEDGGYILGAFPVLEDVSDTAAVAVYLAILATRGLLNLTQTRWPDNLAAGDFDSLADGPFRDPGDMWESLCHFIHPRYDIRFAVPYEFEPHDPYGQLLALCAARHPRSWGDIHRNTKITYRLVDAWGSIAEGPSCAPRVVWQAIKEAEAHLGQFSKRITDAAWSEKEAELLDVEVFPIVSADGHAALWLAAMRDAKLAKTTRGMTWPSPAEHDVRYFETFGNSNTRRLAKNYLRPLISPTKTARKRISK